MTISLLLLVAGRFLAWQDSGLQLSPPTPGFAEQVNTLEVTGATPGERVFFFYAFYAGKAPVPTCPDARLNLQ